tara:strand:+ start:199 stop:597 length:399 start_codon:yes stop_codon:yes gene_type:complete
MIYSLTIILLIIGLLIYLFPKQAHEIVNYIIGLFNGDDNKKDKKDDGDSKIIKKDDNNRADKVLRKMIERPKDTRRQTPKPMEMKSGKKSVTGPGWCYIGVDTDNKKVCVDIGENDRCMSGKVYASKSECKK